MAYKIKKTAPKSFKKINEKYYILKSKDWFKDTPDKKQLKNFKEWGWLDKEDYMIVRFNKQTNKLIPVKYNFKNQEEAKIYLNNRKFGNK